MTLCTAVVAVLVMAGCGGGGSFANKPRPAVPVNLTVYINDARVSLSPKSVGAGEVVFIVTNQSSKAQSLTIKSPGSSKPLGSTGPINPQATSQVAVDFTKAGNYTVATSGGSGTDAALASQDSIQPATLRITSGRPSSNDQLLQP